MTATSKIPGAARYLPEQRGIDALRSAAETCQGCSPFEDATHPELTYQTNAVKHFKFTRKGGKRRIHHKPGRTEVVACRPWLIAEIEAVQPEVIVCLGATAAQSLLGAAFRVSVRRGQEVELPSSIDVRMTPEPIVVATVHPSSVLRDRSDRHDEVYRSFVDDLRSARSGLA
ncbi:uracil-DNA glycosylase family protein [Mycobacterium sp.]|uniref:uracil-DNA glycosylase family protein n=1 Tax=Mycobacterium sp. TaxID=1785 RepID=UPI0012166178|nr:uracil-DNA glycosylase family protein [Mycobacterium sp.]TAM68079.1 MAG: uracil-DNA glycosylase [Mycobacterium sp.]